MAGKSVAERPASVPDLVRTPSLDIGVGDIALPRIRVGNHMSKAVMGNGAKFGQLYASASADDTDPDVLYDPETDSPGVLVHVLALKKGWSLFDNGSTLQWDYDDPSRPPEAWRTYDYTLALPEVDPDVPHKMLLTKTALGTALKINTALAKTASSGPPWNIAFRVKSAVKESTKGKWSIVTASLATPTAEQIEIAANLASVLSPMSIEHAATGEVPAI